MPNILIRLLGRSMRTSAPAPISNALSPAPMGQSDSPEEVLLDASSGEVLHVPPPPNHEATSGRRPPQYWKAYDAAKALYQRGSYNKTKAELLAARGFGELHPTARTLLLRTYRKLVAAETTEQPSPERAIAVYDSMFRDCADDITNTDRRNYNRLLDLLSPSSQLRRPRLAVAGRAPVPSFQVLSSPVWEVTMLEEHPPVGKDLRGRGGWRFSEVCRQGEVYARPVYNTESSECTHTVVMSVASDHLTPTVWSIEGRVRLLAAARVADVIATVTFSLELCTWTTAGKLLAKRSLADLASGPYELRSLAVSPDGQHVLVTATDRVRLFDRRLSVMARWRVPMNPGYTKVSCPSDADPLRDQLREDLATLGLSEFPSGDELRRAFRQSVFRYHPDRNPDDPVANFRTRIVIEAYERLSGEDAAEAFAGLPDADEYYRVVSTSKVEVPGYGPVEFFFGVSGRPLDWVYAAAYAGDGKTIYLASYAGKVYCVSATGRVLRTYDLGEGLAIRAVHESDRCVIVHTYGHIHVFGDKCLLQLISCPWRSDLAWGDWGFCLWHGKSLQGYTGEGRIGFEIRTKESIANVLWHDDTLIVDTANARLLLSTRPGSSPSHRDA